jgi:hypothetical protein
VFWLQKKCLTELSNKYHDNHRVHPYLRCSCVPEKKSRRVKLHNLNIFSLSPLAFLLNILLPLIPVTRKQFVLKYKKFWGELIAYFPWYDTDRRENEASNNSIVACVFVAALNFFLSSRCLATVKGTRNRHTDCWEGFMKYVAEMGLGAIIYMPSFTNTVSAI